MEEQLKKLLFFPLILTFMANSFLYSLDPRLLKDTYNPLHEGEKHFSLIYGAALWETSVLWNYYKFGPDEDTNIKLIKNLFTEALGDFVPSSVNNKIAAHLNPYLIGKILGSIPNQIFEENFDFEALKQELTQSITGDKVFRKSVLKTEKTFKSIEQEIKDFGNSNNSKILKSFKETYEGYNEIENLDVIKKSLDKELKTIVKQLNKIPDPKKIKKQINRLKEKLNTGLTKEQHDRITAAITKQQERLAAISKTALKNKERLEGEIGLLRDQETFIMEKQRESKHSKSLKNLEKKLYENAFQEDESVSDFANNLVDAFKQPEYATYPSYFPFAVLQAFLYATSETKNDIWEYFRGIESQKLNEVLNVDKERFIESKYTENKNEIYEKNAYFVNPQFYENQNIDDYLEEICVIKILYDYYLGGLPRIANYNAINFQGVRFPDCVETTFRNFAQIVSFFDGSFGGIGTLEGINPKEKFINFIKKLTPSNLSNEMFHQEWATFTQNKKYLSYYRIAQKESYSKSYYNPSGTEGFVIIDPEDVPQKRINNNKTIISIAGENKEFTTFSIEKRTYIIVDPNQYVAFELVASLKNLIILFNEIFGLNLFEISERSEVSESESSELEMSIEFVEDQPETIVDGFLEAFFKPTFNSTYFPRLCEKLGISIISPSNKNILNTEDNEDLDIDLKKNNEEFYLSLRTGHGEIHKKPTSRENLNLPFEFDDRLTPNSECLIPNFYDYFPATANEIQDKRNLFLIKLIDMEERINLIDFALKNGLNNEIIIKIINSLPTDTETTEKMLEWVKIYGNRNKYLLNEAIKLASEGLKHINLQIREKSLEVLNNLIDMNFDLKDVLQLAVQGVFNEHAWVYNPFTIAIKHNIGILLFKSIFNKNMGFNLAMTTALKGIDDEKYKVKLVSLELFKNLLERNIRSLNLNNTNENIKTLIKKALSLIAENSRKKEEFIKGIDVHNIESIPSLAIEQDLGLNEIAKFILLEKQNKKLTPFLLKILNALIDADLSNVDEELRDDIITLAIKWAKNLKSPTGEFGKDERSIIIRHASSLFKKLLEKGYMSTEETQIAPNGSED